MRYRYTVIYSRFRWRRSGTRSYIADLVDCRLWLLGGGHLLKRLDTTAIICYNRGVIGAGYLLYQIIHCRSGTRLHITCWYWNTPVSACARTLHTRTYAYARGELEAAASWARAGRELEAANAMASWTRAGKFDTSWKMCYNKAVIKERSCYNDPSRLD